MSTKVAYIYQYNELNNGHSILDKRLSAALERLYKEDFCSLQYNLQAKGFIQKVNKEQIDTIDTVIILSHFNTFRIAGSFKKSKVVFINHDLPYFAYLLQRNLPGIIKAGYSWLYIHYYWKFSRFNFFISKLELKKSGYPAERSAHIKIGTKPIEVMPVFTSIVPEAVFTGNYKWSLKAQSLQAALNTKYTGALKLAALNVDERFFEIVSSLKIPVTFYKELPNLHCIRIGIITDNFLSGFKLKALELISMGCCLASFVDITYEFDDIPHYSLFIHTIKSLDELDSVYNMLLQEDEVVKKFTVFYNEVCEKFNWNQTAAEIKDTLANF